MGFARVCSTAVPVTPFLGQLRGELGSESGAALLEALAGLSAALLRGETDAARSARERLFAELSRSDAIGRVVFRDLADHAAIHYVRVLLRATYGSGDGS